MIATPKILYNYPHKLSDSLIYDIDNDTIRIISIYQDSVLYQLVNPEISKNQNYYPDIFISLDKRMIWISTITKDRRISTVSVISTKTWKKIGEYQTESLNLTISYFPEYLPTFLMPKDESTFWISEHLVFSDIKDPVCPVIDMSIISSFTILKASNGIYVGKFPDNTFNRVKNACYSLNGEKIALNISYPESYKSLYHSSHNIYDSKTGSLLLTDISPNKGNYYSSVLSYSGDTLFTNTDSVLYALSTIDGSEFYNVKLPMDNHRNSSYDEMQISSDGKYIGIVTNKLLYILQSSNGSMYRTIANTDTSYYSLRAFHFEHGTNNIIIVNYLGTITVNNIISGAQTNICSTPKSVNLGYPISWSAKGDKMLVGRYLINTHTGNVIYTFPDFKNPPFCNSNCLTTDGTYCIVEYQESDYIYSSGWKNSATDSLFCSGLNARILARSYDSKQILYLKENNGYTYGSNMTYILSNTNLCPEIIMDVHDTPKENSTLENSVAITPNPITSYSNITFNQETEAPVELLIYDTRGLSTSVYYNPNESVGIHQIEIDMHSFANGAYYLVYKSNTLTTSSMFIKLDE
ncbi:MAG: hypothetical protein JNJ85_06760 [Candidatus Kapabacteria bacterium]|nr:hypothetical protein [Candidatus Kapabacteria bacterium]